jgi:hypothetical protein
MKNVKTFDQLLDEKYGKKGNTERNQFDADSLAFSFMVLWCNCSAKGGNIFFGFCLHFTSISREVDFKWFLS